MDLTPTADEAALRAEVRDWLKANLPWEYGKGLPPRFDDLADEVAFGRQWQGKLAEGRWVGVGWPEEYGGRGAGAVEHFIVIEELARARAPELVGRIGINLVGPTLLAHGTSEQKQWLSDILPAGNRRGRGGARSALSPPLRQRLLVRRACHRHVPPFTGRGYSAEDP